MANEKKPTENREKDTEKDTSVEAPASTDPKEGEDDFHKVVTTPAGTEKHVVGNDRQEVKDGVEAAKNEQAPVALDINNPAHGNLTDEQRQELDKK